MSDSALALACEASAVAFWARRAMSRPTPAAAKNSKRKIQLIKFMGDSKEEDPKSHQHPV